MRAKGLTAIRFRNHLLQTIYSHGAESRRVVMRKTIRAFKAYIEGKELNKFLGQSDFVYQIPE